MCLLKVSGIGKRENGITVLEEISFTQQQFQKIAVAGSTGSGKTTLLKIIAGLVQPDAGTVLFENTIVEGPAEKLIPGHPAIAYLSQQFELRNNYRVEEILSYANTLPDEEADTLFDVCRITHLLKRKTDQLSGGERQRIAMARLLIASPELLLLDEPFSNLDMIHKSMLKHVIRDISKRLHITCMLISHDPADTLSWADEIIILKDGRIIQQGSPVQVYKQPVDIYAAALFGKYHLLSPALCALFGLQKISHNETNVFVRPENFTIVDDSTAPAGTVKEVIFCGSHYEVEVALSADVITIKTEKRNLKKGDTVYVAIDNNTGWQV